RIAFRNLEVAPVGADREILQRLAIAIDNPADDRPAWSEDDFEILRRCSGQVLNGNQVPLRLIEHQPAALVGKVAFHFKGFTRALVVPAGESLLTIEVVFAERL